MLLLAYNNLTPKFFSQYIIFKRHLKNVYHAINLLNYFNPNLFHYFHQIGYIGILNINYIFKILKTRNGFVKKNFKIGKIRDCMPEL